MKNQESNAPQMDEIVFEKRNKMYGAFILRKMYNNQVNKALLMAIAIMLAGLAYPLASSYNAVTKTRHITTDVIIDILNLPKPDDVVLPPPPAANPDQIKHVPFIAPVVTIEEVKGEDGLPDMEKLNQTAVNEPINIEREKAIEKQVDVIEDPEKVAPVTFVEEMPTFTGGETERLRFLQDNIQYPQRAAETGIQGSVYVRFVVDSKGNITDAEVLRGIGGGCDEEALRVINAMPQWHPGKQNGRAVRVFFNMSIMFKLQNN